MAQHFFVPGPSVRPNFGSPAEFIAMLQKTAEGFGNRRVAADKVVADKLFRDQTLAQKQSEIDFTQAAPERKELLRVEALARDADKFQTVQDFAKGAEFAGADRFTGFDEELNKDPRFAGLDDAGKLAAKNEFILKNPSALTSPKRFAEILTSGLSATGKFTGAELESAVAKEVAERYPTADPAIIKSILAKPEFKIGSGTGAGAGSTRGGASFGLLNDPTNPDARGTVVDRISSTFNLSDRPTTVPGIIPFIGGKRIDPGDLDPSKQDISVAVGLLSTKGVNSPTAQEAALNIAFNADGTIKEGFDWRTPAGLKKLTAAGLKSQETEERIFNKRGGDVSNLGQAAGGNSAADIVKQVEKFNAGLLARLTPRAQSDSQVVSAFLDSLGATAAPTTDTPRQGDEGGRILTPEVVDSPVVENNADVDPDVSARPLGPTDQPAAIPDAPVNRAERIFPTATTAQDIITPGASPLQKLADIARTRNARLVTEENEKIATEERLFKAAQKGGFKERKAYADWIKANR